MCRRSFLDLRRTPNAFSLYPFVSIPSATSVGYIAEFAIAFRTGPVVPYAEVLVALGSGVHIQSDLVHVVMIHAACLAVYYSRPSAELDDVRHAAIPVVQRIEFLAQVGAGFAVPPAPSYILLLARLAVLSLLLSVALRVVPFVFQDGRDVALVAIPK